MKGITVQLVVSSVALVLMAGGGGLHWWKVQGLEAKADSPDWTSLPVERPPKGWAVLTSLGAQDPAPTEDGRPTRDEMNATLKALENVVDVLRDLKEENSSLRDQNSDLIEQVREINMNINELELRADSTSESFRPLKVQPREEGIIQSEHPLLPSKPRRAE